MGAQVQPRPVAVAAAAVLAAASFSLVTYEDPSGGPASDGGIGTAEPAHGDLASHAQPVGSSPPTAATERGENTAPTTTSSNGGSGAAEAPGTAPGGSSETNPANQPQAAAEQSEATAGAPAGDRTDPSPPAEPGGFRSPPAGTFVYQTEGSTRTGGAAARPLPSETTLRISQTSVNGVQTWMRDLRDADGRGEVTAYDMVAADERLQLLRVTTTSPDGDGVQRTRSFAARVAGVLAAAGDEADTIRRMALESTGSSVSLQTRVLGYEPVTVSGREVDAVVVEHLATYEGEVAGTTTRRLWLRSADLLLLREEVTSRREGLGRESETNYVAEIIDAPPS